MSGADPIWDEMPADVRATIDLLVEEGFRVVEASIGTMASGIVRLSSDVDATVTRDRGQWMFDFHVDGKNLDLEALVAARTGQHTWTSAHETATRPVKIPDIEWRDEVPAALDWLRTSPAAVARVEDAKRLRSKITWS